MIQSVILVILIMDIFMSYCEYDTEVKDELDVTKVIVGF